jgi:glycosyltransferase involved in cell wall biosynthesis
MGIMFNKTIWLVNVYAMPPDKELRIQTLKRAQYLKKKGFNVYVFCGSHLHNSKVNLINDKKLFLHYEYENINYVHIRNSTYYNSFLKRILSLIQFYCRLFRVSNFFKKPDYISLYSSIPFSNVVYYLAKKHKAKLVLEVVDLWPEVFVSLGLISKYNPFLHLAYFAEKWIYKRADTIVFSMEGGLDYIRDKKWHTGCGSINLNKVKYINNGVDLKDFNANRIEYSIDDQDLTNDNIFKIIYLGSIRHANGVNLILDAAKELSSIKSIKFLIYGDGPERIKIKNRIVNENISNVILKQEWVELKYVPYILSKSSLNLLNYAKNTIFRYGGSQSKSFQYMASGRPICSNVEMAYCPINKFNLGIAKDFKNALEYAEAILDIYNMSKEKYNELCNNATLASQAYDYEYLTNKYTEYCLNE